MIMYLCCSTPPSDKISNLNFKEEKRSPDIAEGAEDKKPRHFDTTSFTKNVSSSIDQRILPLLNMTTAGVTTGLAHEFSDGGNNDHSNSDVRKPKLVKASAEVGCETCEDTVLSTEVSPPKSESCRSYEPEGSDMTSPPYSETMSTPSYVRWVEDIQFLLDDHDGMTLFKEYMFQEGLDDIISFWLACEGLKKQTMKENMIVRLIKLINRKFLKPRQGTLYSIIPHEIRVSITDQITSEQSINEKIFDEAQTLVKNHMSRTAYPNFLKSDTFTNYVRLQNGDCDVRSKSSGGGEVISSASSVSGRVVVHVPVREDSNSGVSDMSSSKSHPLASVSNDTSSTVLVGGLLGSALPTLHEASELDITPANQTSKLLTRDVIKHQTLTSAKCSRRCAKDTSFPISNCVAPNPYHAYSSTYNPVTRQASETQSMSSGALGDTTDDNYSTFTDPPTNHSSKRLPKVAGYQLDKRVIHHSKVNAVVHDKIHKEEQIRHMHENLRLNRQDPHENIVPRPNRQGLQPPKSNNLSPEEFSRILSQKLHAYIKDEERKLKMRQSLGKIEPNEKDVSSSKNPDIIKSFRNVSLAADESDQSILDDHVDRIWKTPIGQRSPGEQPYAGPSRRHRHGRTSDFQTGNRTLPAHNRTTVPYFLNPCFQNPVVDSGGPSFMTSSKSFGDIIEIQSGPSVNAQYIPNRSAVVPNQPTVAGMVGNSRVVEWVQRQQSHSSSGGSGGGGNFNTFNASSVEPEEGHLIRQDLRSSPRSMTRMMSRPVRSERARSQDRLHTSWHHVPGGSSINQSLTSYPRSAQYHNPSIYATRHHHDDSYRRPPVDEDYTIAKYTFSQSRDDLPYSIRIPRQPHGLTLRTVKSYLPKPGKYRFFFKTYEDGDVVLQEGTSDSEIVPLFNAKIIVECRADSVDSIQAFC